ncbi:protein-disulfide reductase DsbD [Marinobacter salicampi]|uniref:protein-disulfide reductase DsbD n=1 Tax=Marinobacter salicampi TaxID=435907 RepID=UPI001407EAD1|nr:protein-disulfide reductase DsbD [Marinobacter salicampi]
MYRNRALHSGLAFILFLLSAQVGAISSPFSGSSSGTFASSNSGDFLPVGEAFQLEMEVAGDQIFAHWDIASDYYLYQSRIDLETADAELGSLEFATDGEMKDDPTFGPMAVYYGEADVSAAILSAPADEVALTLTYQGCSEDGLCYPPETRNFTVDLSSNEISASDAGTAPGSGSASTPAATQSTSGYSTSTGATGLTSFLETSHWGVILLTFFVFGLGLTFTPCVLPMIPILSGIVMGQRERPSTSRAFVLSLSYVLGMATTYALAGVAVGYFGASANLQAMMQQPWILSLFGVLFVLLALSMFGLYELQLPAALRDRLDNLNRRQKGGQVVGVTVMGVLSALAVSPCVTAPLAAALFYISSTGDALLGGAALFLLALGMGAPLLIIGTMGTRLLPKAGAWMVRVKEAFGIILLGVAIWLVERVLPDNLGLALWALLLIGVGVHLGALKSSHTGGWARSAQALGLAALLWGSFVLWGAAQGSGSLWQPITASSGGQGQTQPHASPFERVDGASELAALLGSGTPVMFDFYADWCVSCIIMEETVFAQPEVVAYKDDMKFVQIDITDFDADHKALLDQYNLAGPPAVLFFDGNGEEIRGARIMGEVGLEEFLWRVKDQVL